MSIVKLLRGGPWERHDPEISGIMLDGAIEIERLQNNIENREFLLADAIATIGRLQAEIERLTAIERTARLLIADVRNRHPEQELYCPFMRALDRALEQKP